MGEHCEYRVDIHDDPFHSKDRVRRKEKKNYSIFVLILIIVLATVVGLAATFSFRGPLVETETAVTEPTAVVTNDASISSSKDGIIRDNNKNGAREGEAYHLECQGFSSVELL